MKNFENRIKKLEAQVFSPAYTREQIAAMSDDEIVELYKALDIGNSRMPDGRKLSELSDEELEAMIGD